jgi:hypothetical protein
VPTPDKYILNIFERRDEKDLSFNRKVWNFIIADKRQRDVVKAVNREDKRSRRYRDRDFAKFERSRRYRDR